MPFMDPIYMVWFLIEEPPSVIHTSHVPLVCVPCEPCSSALNYVAGYTGPLLFLVERTHKYYVDNQGLVPWQIRRVGRSKVCSASLVIVLSDGKIS